MKGKPTMVLNKKTALLLFVAGVLLCRVSYAERGNAVHTPRQLAVGDRPTNDPASSPTHNPTDNGDDDGGKGRPTPKGDDDDESGKGKGRPPKGDENNKGGKGRPTAKGDDDDDDDDDTSSGKGENGKGIDVHDDDELYMSYMIGKGKGKGKGLSKSPKSSKYEKSGKSDKSVPKPKPKPAPTPTAPTPTEPTTEPVAPTPTTPSPTSENSIPIRALPYALTYAPSSSVPSTADFAQLAEITRLYMEEFMIAEFEGTSLTNLDDFVTFMTRNEFEAGEPVFAQYRSTGLFNPSSIFLPTVRELNQLISEAFNEENLPNYLERVQSLPRANPFSDTDTIEFMEVDEDDMARQSDTAGSFMRAGIAASAAGIVVLAAGLAVMRSRTSCAETDDDTDQTISPLKKISGDSTVAGETCSTSVDGSSVAQSWKTPVAFQNGTAEEEEFQDEPLDSDDEDSSMSSRQATVRFPSACSSTATF